MLSHKKSRSRLRKPSASNTKASIRRLEEASRVSPGFRGRLEHLVDEVDCTVCGGSRLRDDAAAMRFRDRTIDEICRMPLGKMLADFQAWKPTASERKVAGEVYREICNRTQFLVDVGLDYLTLARPAPTLSGGEMQRIRLAAQVGSGLCGVLYVLDEPTIGLHPRDNTRLLNALKRLRDLGNTLLLVEHDREVIAAARSHIGLRPRRRPPRWADRRRGHTRRSWQTPRVGHRPLSHRQEGHSRADEPASGGGVACRGGERERGRGGEEEIGARSCLPLTLSPTLPLIP